MDLGLRDRAAIVTGASRGIGLMIADALALAGAEVAAFDVGEPERGKSFAHRFVRVDIADAEAVRQAVAGLAPAPSLLGTMRASRATGRS